MIQLTDIQKRAVLKIAVELVKADNLIHYREISMLDSLCDELGLEADNVDLVHYLSIEAAVNTLRGIDSDNRKLVLQLFDKIVCVDNDVDFDERLLLSAVTMACVDESKEWCRVVSILNPLPDFIEKQVIYLESGFTDSVHKVFDDKYDNLLISKAFGDAGFELFFLPNVLAELSDVVCGDGADSDRKALLARSMGYMVPSADNVSAERIGSSLSTLDTAMFYRLILSRSGIDPDSFPFNSFLLIKIRGSQVFGDDGNVVECSDFMCIDISENVKSRILAFISNFDTNKTMLSYQGYYKFLYDYLSSESQITEPLEIDSEATFSIKGQPVIFESAPQTKTLYLLLLMYGKNGVRNECMADAANVLKRYMDGGGTDVGALCSRLASEHTEASTLLLRLIRIYNFISTKDILKPDFLKYILNILLHRSSLKTYANSGFASMPKGVNATYFCIAYNAEYKSYSVPASPSLIKKSNLLDSITR